MQVFNNISFFIFLFTGIISTTYAQSAYRGGRGDGYSMAYSGTAHIDGSGKSGTPAVKDNIYPNPIISGSDLSISFAIPPKEFFLAELIDVPGKICLRETITATGSTAVMTLPPVAQGMYFLRIISGSSVKVYKLFILSRK